VGGDSRPLIFTAATILESSSDGWTEGCMQVLMLYTRVVIGIQAASLGHASIGTRCGTGKGGYLLDIQRSGADARDGDVDVGQCAAPRAVLRRTSVVVLPARRYIRRGGGGGFSLRASLLSSPVSLETSFGSRPRYSPRRPATVVHYGYSASSPWPGSALV
jgi:hypothetical protein